MPSTPAWSGAEQRDAYRALKIVAICKSKDNKRTERRARSAGKGREREPGEGTVCELRVSAVGECGYAVLC